MRTIDNKKQREHRYGHKNVLATRRLKPFTGLSILRGLPEVEVRATVGSRGNAGIGRANVRILWALPLARFFPLKWQRAGYKREGLLVEYIKRENGKKRGIWGIREWSQICGNKRWAVTC